MKDGGEEIGNEGTNSKKVSMSLTFSIPLMQSFVDSVEGAQDTQAAREGREGRRNGEGKEGREGA